MSALLTVSVLEPILADSRTVKTSLRPSWTRVLNEKNSLSVGASWLEMEYDTQQFSDYEQYGVDATWVRQLNERLNLQIGVYQSRFNSGVAPDIFNDSSLALTSSETLGLSTGLTRQFNEQLTGSITIGTRQVDTKTRFCGQYFLIFYFL